MNTQNHISFLPISQGTIFIRSSVSSFHPLCPSFVFVPIPLWKCDKLHRAFGCTKFCRFAFRIKEFVIPLRDGLSLFINQIFHCAHLAPLLSGSKFSGFMPTVYVVRIQRSIRNFTKWSASIIVIWIMQRIRFKSCASCPTSWISWCSRQKSKTGWKELTLILKYP